MQDEVPDAGLEVLSCRYVLYDVVVVGLDLQDDKIERDLYIYKSKMYK